MGALAEQIRGFRIDDQAPAHGGAPQQHAKLHRVAIGERQLDRPGVGAESYVCTDDVSQFAVSARVADPASVDHLGAALRDDVGTPLHGMETEPDVVAPAVPIGADLEGVERGGARPRVDLSLDRRDAEVREREPFAPTDSQWRVNAGQVVDRWTAG